MTEYRRILLDGASVQVVRDGDELVAGDGRRVAVAEAVHLPPCEPTKIVAVHLNHSSRVAEFGVRLPAAPTYFHKPVSALVGHGGAVIRPANCKYLNYEGEVAIVIGKKARKVPQSKVADHIWGVTTCVDWSIRDGDDNGNRTFRHAKNFDTSVSMGPSIVVGELDAQNQDMETRLNGELRQQYNSKGMTYSFAEIVEFLSANFTLFPGFVLSGGCGPGTAMETGDPAKFLKPGDVVEYTSPRVGTLRNRIVAEED